MAGVDIRAVHKHFGSTHVIRGVDIAIADGEFCVLVGHSGCGKSTLLRMIAGLEEIGTGEVAIGGTVVNRVPPKERDIAMVFQNYALYPHMTVRENMAFALALAAGQLPGLALQQWRDFKLVGDSFNILADDALGAATARQQPAEERHPLQHRQAFHPERDRDIVEHAEMRIERVRLEHHRQIARARPHAVSACAIDADFAR